MGESKRYWSETATLSAPWWVVLAEQEFKLQGAIFRPDKATRILECVRDERTVAPEQVVAHREPVSMQDLRRVHTASYLARLGRYAETVPAYAVAELEIPLSVANLRAAELACGGTLRAAALAITGGRGAVHLGGGFHHAFPGHGEGFCLLHDVAVALRALLEAGGRRTAERNNRNDDTGSSTTERLPQVSRALVVDLDAHQGNGTARIFRDEPRVYTLSLHNAEIYPHPKEPSDFDVPLPAGTGDAGYQAALEQALPRALAESRLTAEGGAATEATQARPLVVLLAGVDPYYDDRLGGLALTREGLRTRTATVLRAAAQHMLPVLVVLAGGYARNAETQYQLHADTLREAAAHWS